MILHRVAKENYNLFYSLGVTGSGAGMVLVPLIAEFLRQSYGWRGGLLIISALMANIIPVGMAIEFDSHKNSRQRNGFQSVPSLPPGCNEGKESNSSASQDTKGELDRKTLLDRQLTRPAVSCDRHYRSRKPSKKMSKGQEDQHDVLVSCWSHGSSTMVTVFLEDSLDLHR